MKLDPVKLDKMLRLDMMLVERIGTDSMLIDILITIFPNEDFIIIPNRH